jgi:hypothetical protein
MTQFESAGLAEAAAAAPEMLAATASWEGTDRMANLVWWVCKLRVHAYKQEQSVFVAP